MYYFRVPGFFVLAILLSVTVQAQIARSRNNPYSPSPDGGRKTTDNRETDSATLVAINPTARVVSSARPESEPPSRPLPLTEQYKVGIGDVLLVKVANVSQGHGYYSITSSGTLEFSLAGGEIVAAGKTTEAIARELAARITLFESPEVEVTVREYGSHKITVAGLVDHPGEKNLQREAIPLFVIRAEVGVQSRAGQAVIKRAPMLKSEVYSLADRASDDVLIYPGNEVEFTEGERASTQIYFIKGDVAAPGQKQLVSGQTLYQAVAGAGGATRSARKGVILRKDATGVLTASRYDLRAIRDGKAADPPLVVGDIIEIGK